MFGKEGTCNTSSPEIIRISVDRPLVFLCLPFHPGGGTYVSEKIYTDKSFFLFYTVSGTSYRNAAYTGGIPQERSSSKFLS